MHAEFTHRYLNIFNTSIVSPTYEQREREVDRPLQQWKPSSLEQSPALSPLNPRAEGGQALRVDP